MILRFPRGFITRCARSCIHSLVSYEVAQSPVIKPSVKLTMTPPVLRRFMASL